MTIRVLVCADSFGVTDDAFPGLSWSEKISQMSPDVEVLNLSQSGASNALIQLQLHQGLRLRPDFVIFSFTDADRLELDPECDFEIVKNRGTYYQTSQDGTNSVPTAQALRHWNEKQFITNCWLRAPDATQMFNKCYYTLFSSEASVLKSYLQILSCFTMLNSLGVPFCFNLGGFDPGIFRADYHDVIKQHYLTDELGVFAESKLSINLWQWQDSPSENSPPFHISDPAVHERFATECLLHLRKYHASEKMY